MGIPKRVARDFSDDVLQRKYEEELYNRDVIKRKISRLKEYMNFYIIAALWMVVILIFPKFCIAVMAFAMFLTYKLECLNEKYFYHIGIMSVLTAGYVLAEFGIFAPLGVFYIIITVVYVIAAFVSTIKYYIFTRTPFKFLTEYFGKYHLGTQLYECNEKLYRLESELLSRKQIDDNHDMYAKSTE